VRPLAVVARAALIAALACIVAACGTGGPSPSPAPSAGAPQSIAPTDSAEPSATPVALTVGLGFTPNVQFAPFYLAQQSGAYADAGLDVTLQNQIDSDLIPKLGQGAVDIGSGDGTSVIPAVSQGIPVVYTSTIYGQFPSIVFAKPDSGIKSAADLKGRKIGIPGKYGSSWIMLQALLQSAGLTPDDVEIIEFPEYTQAAALQQGVVDAATGFANNEPIQLRKAGIEPVILTVGDIVPLPGPGLVTGRGTLETKRDALAAFTLVTLNAMDEIAADPQKGLDATFAAVPDLAQDKDLQAAILDATIATWKNPRSGAAYGTIDRDAWQQSVDFMGTIGLVPNPVTVDQLVDDSLLPT
jgi:NitT/TauT family transport system substrate-binding protein